MSSCTLAAGAVNCIVSAAVRYAPFPAHHHHANSSIFMNMTRLKMGLSRNSVKCIPLKEMTSLIRIGIVHPVRKVQCMLPRLRKVRNKSHVHPRAEEPTTPKQKQNKNKTKTKHTGAYLHNQNTQVLTCTIKCVGSTFWSACCACFQICGPTPLDVSHAT